MPLGKNADAGDYVKDFQKSDAPQFKGKSKEKRRKMAIAAYLDSKDKKESTMQEATYKVEIDGGIETVTARTEKEAIRKAARKQGNSKSVGKVFGPKVKVTKIKEEAQMKSFDDIRVELSEAKNAAQQAAIAIAKKEKGEEPKEEGKKMDSAAMAKAMAAFKKKGGKVKKIAPGKAAGYHGKDDPGDGVQGMMDRGDTKGFNRKKKIGSMR